MEGEIAWRGGIDGIKRNPVIQQHSQHRVYGVRCRLHHFMSLRVTHHYIRRHRTGCQRVRHGKGQARLGIEIQSDGILILFMVVIDRVRSEETGFGSCRPIRSHRKPFGYAGTFVVGIFAQLGLFVGTGILFLYDHMRRGQRFVCSFVEGIYVQERFSVFDTLALGGFGFSGFLPLRLALGGIALALLHLFGMRTFLRGSHGIGIVSSCQQEESH